MNKLCKYINEAISEKSYKNSTLYYDILLF